jgi:hypothetical protein
VQKTGVRISKTLLKAQLLSFLTAVVIGSTLAIVLLYVPGTVWQLAHNFQSINNYNPAVAYSPYFRGLSQTANLEDWALFTPIAFLISGLVFGWVVSNRNDRLSNFKALIATGVGISFIFLALSDAGSYVQATSANTSPPELGWQTVVMAIVQTVYWTMFMLLGYFGGCKLHKLRHRSGDNRISPSRAQTVAK